MRKGENGKFINGTIRCFIKLTNINDALDKLNPQKPISRVMTEDDRNYYGTNAILLSTLIITS